MQSNTLECFVLLFKSVVFILAIKAISWVLKPLSKNIEGGIHSKHPFSSFARSDANVVRLCISRAEAYATEHIFRLEKLCRVTTEKLFHFLHSFICPHFTEVSFTSHLDQKNLTGLHIIHSCPFGVTASGNIRQLIQNLPLLQAAT